MPHRNPPIDDGPPPGSHIHDFMAHKSNGRAPAAFQIIYDGEADMAPQHGWLVKQLIPAQGAGLLAGQSGVGKTFTVIDLALSTILGTEFAGRAIEKQGGVLLFAAEGATLVRRRWEAVKQAKGKPWFAAQGQELPKLPFGWITECPVLTADNALVMMTGACKQMQIKLRSTYETGLSLVIVDTLMAAAMFKDPNDAGEAQRAMNVLSKLAQDVDTVVLAVDHFGKDPDRGIRGSSAKEAAADFVLAIKGTKLDSGVTADLEMVVTKLRGGASGLRTSFNLAEVAMGEDEDGDDVKELVVHWHDGKVSKPVPKQNKRFALLLRAMDEALIDSGRMQSPAIGWPVVRLVEDRIIGQFFLSGYPPTGDEKTRKETVRKAYKRAMKDAVGQFVVASFAPANGEVLVWKVTPDSNGHIVDSQESVRGSVTDGHFFPTTLSSREVSVTDVRPDDDVEMEF